MEKKKITFLWQKNIALKKSYFFLIRRWVGLLVSNFFKGAINNSNFKSVIWNVSTW